MNEPGIVSAFDAKTHLSGLLRSTEQGQSFIIKRRGKAVARLVPVQEVPTETDLLSLSKRCQALRQEIAKNSKRPLRVKDLIDEGR